MRVVGNWLEPILFPKVRQLDRQGNSSLMARQDRWRNVERHKWNSDHPLLLNTLETFDAPEPDTPWPRCSSELRIDHGNTNAWPTLWRFESALGYFESYYPCGRLLRERTGGVIDDLMKELEQAMGPKEVERAVHWPIVLLLAAKR